MPRLITIDLDEIEQRLNQAHAKWQAALAAKNEANAYAKTHHVSPGAGYWEEEHRLRARYDRLRAFYEALT